MRLAAAVLALTALPGFASTLEKLSSDDLMRKSTEIVRARVVGGPVGIVRKGMIYSQFRLQVTEVLKGAAKTGLDVAVPGGVTQGLRQTVTGAPTLEAGQEYVFFLWTSRTGWTQIIGLSQGLFTVKADASGAIKLSRPASQEAMLDAKTGRLAPDTPVEMMLDEVRARLAAMAKDVK
ncbi:MAG: hypothetical protein K2X35_02735 [Bryobacteraceae bacterium]|nr:hypothetical protein [Bryobacteraceae bacterium]